MVCLNRPARNVLFLIDDVRASFGWVGCIVSWSVIVTLGQSSPPLLLMRYIRWNGQATAGEGGAKVQSAASLSRIGGVKALCSSAADFPTALSILPSLLTRRSTSLKLSIPAGLNPGLPGVEIGRAHV